MVPRCRRGHYVRWCRNLILLAVSVVLVFVIFRLDLLMQLSVFGVTQSAVDNFAKSLILKHKLLENHVEGSRVALTIHNAGDQTFPKSKWQIVFSQVLGVELPLLLQGKTFMSSEYGIGIRHWNGQVYSIEPLDNFEALKPGETTIIHYHIACCSVVFTDVSPNWYLVFEGLEPRVLASTVGEPADFVSDHDSPGSWKWNPSLRDPSFDHHNPLTAKDRYFKGSVKDLGVAPLLVIPTPLNVSVHKATYLVNLKTETWVVVKKPGFENAIDALTEKLNFESVTRAPNGNYINIVRREIKITLRGKHLPTDETYKLTVNPVAKIITIKASHSAGAFYAVQTLLALMDKEGNVPETVIIDGPRYKYRGLMLDVARNFHSKESIKRYISLMAMYKLNKLHFHLTDDEGWRLEIPDLPELTEIGARRCHDPTETKCLLPFLGSGPDTQSSGSGFYTVEDYKEILRHAVAHHVEVIPEFDMPGHSHAAIKAMEVRMSKYMADNITNGWEYLLSDLKDKSFYFSVQYFSDGAVNPCIMSTYTFIEKIMDEVIKMHAAISPLKIFHFGGDEVPKEAWKTSPLCKSIAKSDMKRKLKEVFVSRVAHLARERDLDLAAWEDGYMEKEKPMKRSSFIQKNVFAYTWNNLWELGMMKRAYILANMGYKVVLTPATNLYLDHPYEPDPKERGLVWASRYVDTKKVFQMMPENIYDNMGTLKNGQPIPECTDEDICPTLVKPENIEGIQGTLFGELLRTEWIVDHMLLPRLLAVAERAWHAAPWEYEPVKQKRDKMLQDDYVNFTNTLGHRELARLDASGYKYRVPPPGAIIKSGKILTALPYPGLNVQISDDGGITWQPLVSGSTSVTNDRDYLLRTKSALGDRYSRVIALL